MGLLSTRLASWVPPPSPASAPAGAGGGWWWGVDFRERLHLSQDLAYRG